MLYVDVGGGEKNIGLGIRMWILVPVLPQLAESWFSHLLKEVFNKRIFGFLSSLNFSQF